MRNLFLSTLTILQLSILAFADDEERLTFEENEGTPTVMDPDMVRELKAKERYEKMEEEKDLPKEEVQVNVLYVPKKCVRKSQKGDLMVVHYTGWLAKSGKKFDTTVDVRRRYVPFEFVIGTGYVIRGWEKSLLDMCPGEKRRLVVPPSLAYGKKGLRGIIPANATLIFLIDLLDLRRATPNYAPMDLFSSLDKDGDRKLSKEEISSYVKYQNEAYRHPSSPSLTEEDHVKMVEEIFAREDKDKDGHISHAEFSGPKLPKKHSEL